MSLETVINAIAIEAKASDLMLTQMSKKLSIVILEDARKELSQTGLSR